MTSTTTPFGPDYAKELITVLLNSMDEGTKKAYRAMWSLLLDFLAEHWQSVLFILTLVLIAAVVNALTGRWGMLGSVLYHYLYFGILFVVGLIWGSDIFVSNFFSVTCTIILYPICYLIVGTILEKTGVRHIRP